MNYGMPYQGSKSSIAKDIINVLPAGRRFVDLFGGGFAMSHCAALSYKWGEIYYNDFNPLLAPLIQKAVHGEYSYDVFRPEFVTREMFNELKDTDGYVKWLWSFGNGGREYLFSRDKEPYKQAAHNLVVFGQGNEWTKSIGADDAVTAGDIKSRRLQWRRYMVQIGKRCDLEQLERLQHLEQLQQLQQLEQLQQLQQLEQFDRSDIITFHCHDYRDYEYREGDVVYCDPPYEGTANYGEPFDSKSFYEWAATRPYTVYFSSYGISDTRYHCFWEQKRRSTYSSLNNCLYVKERIYSNRKQKSRIFEQLSMEGVTDEITKF